MTEIQELAQPPKLPNGTCRIVPLGGLGDIGRNMTVFELNGKLLIVDAGVLFPEEVQPGIDLILPDFDYIKQRLHDIVAIVLTHGHEDHIGAVPYLLRLNPDIPLIGSQLTLALVESKLQQHRIKPLTLEAHDGGREQLGPFDLEFVAVNHSIPDSLAIAIRTEAGTILHTGDFKMDQLPLDGRITDLRAFARLGEEGVDLFMTDSTNAEVPGFTPTEKDIGPVIEQYIGQAHRRVIVASFASHIHRVQQVLNAAVKHGRKVAFVGRSMVNNMGIASKLGYLDIPANTVIELKHVNNYEDHEVVLMSTGSQGEPMAALSRMANDEHRQITIQEDDLVILASSMIPGNENAITRIINGLMKLGANVIHKGNAHVHVSGHASEGELLYCYNIVKPKNVMPIHGEYRHLMANARIAEATGVAKDQVIVTGDGGVIDLVDGVARQVGEVASEYVYVDGRSIGAVTEDDLKDRQVLGEEGFISVIAVIDRDTRTVVSGPEIHSRGVAEDDGVFDAIKPKLVKALEDAASSDKEHSTHQLQQMMRRTLGSWVARKLRRRSMIVPIVIEA
ncbi:MAG: ribonuclease J [Yaniella sp.]|nr:ribonuclease J [Yaniella sp.]